MMRCRVGGVWVRLALIVRAGAIVLAALGIEAPRVWAQPPNPQAPTAQAPTAPAPALALQEELSRSNTELIHLAHFATVEVHNNSFPLLNPKSVQGNGLGSGVIREIHLPGSRGPDDPGEVIIWTNHHVVSLDRALQAAAYWVKLPRPHPDRTRPATYFSVPAQLLYADSSLDQAVLRVSLANVPPEVSQGLRALKPGKVVKGQQVMTYGSPLGNTASAAFGIVSNLSDDPEQGFVFEVTARINGGNSGGPLVAVVDGEAVLVGLNTYKYVSSGVELTGFAISAALFDQHFQRWKQDPGVVRACGIDCWFTPMPIFDRAGWEGAIEQIGQGHLSEDNVYDADQVLTAGVVSDAVAQTVGLRTGDVVLSIDGIPMDVRLYRLRLSYQIALARGQAQLKILRDGKIVELTVAVRDYSDPAEEFVIDGKPTLAVVSNWVVSDLSARDRAVLDPEHPGVLLRAGALRVRVPQSGGEPEEQEIDLAGSLVTAVRIRSSQSASVSPLRAVRTGFAEGLGWIREGIRDGLRLFTPGGRSPGAQDSQRATTQSAPQSRLDQGLWAAFSSRGRRPRGAYPPAVTFVRSPTAGADETEETVIEVESVDQLLTALRARLAADPNLEIALTIRPPAQMGEDGREVQTENRYEPLEFGAAIELPPQKLTDLLDSVSLKLKDKRDRLEAKFLSLSPQKLRELRDVYNLQRLVAQSQKDSSHPCADKVRELLASMGRTEGL